MSLKLLSFAWIVALGIVSPARADSVPPTILKHIKPFQIDSVGLASGTLRVVMKRPMVSDFMYHSVAINGICTALFGEPNGWGNARIDRIEVLNDIGAQGFALLDAKTTCGRVGKLADVESKQAVAAQTVSCISGSCKR